MNHNILLFAQILGLLSFALGIFAFYQKSDKKLKITMVILNISAHDRNTKLNLANAYQIKNEAID